MTTSNECGPARNQAGRNCHRWVEIVRSDAARPAAVAYLAPGSFAIAFKQTRSKARGIAGVMVRAVSAAQP